MKTKISLKELAKEAGVSVATVSLALNQRKGVNEQTKEKILHLAEEMGYNSKFPSLQEDRPQNRVIGLVVPDTENPYYGKVVKHVDQNAKKLGYDLILALSNENPETEYHVIESFMRQKVDGVIVAPISSKGYVPRYLPKLKNKNIPCVFITAYYPGEKAPYVMMDLEDGTYQLVSYLLDLGHRDIIFLTGDKSVVASSTRINGYKRAFTERKISYMEDNFINCGKLDFDQAYITVRELIKNCKMDAIITLNDIMALGALKALDEAGVSVPGDVSLGGYDNMSFSSVSLIPITTVSQNIEAMCWNATNMLYHYINKNEKEVVNEEILIKPELIIRKSTSVKMCRKEGE